MLLDHKMWKKTTTKKTSRRCWSVIDQTNYLFSCGVSPVTVRRSIYQQIRMSMGKKKSQFLFPFVLHNKCGKISTLQAWLWDKKKKKKRGKSQPTCALHPAAVLALPLARLWTERSDRWRWRSKSLWALFPGTTHAHSLCVATATRLFRSIPQPGAPRVD